MSKCLSPSASLLLIGILAHPCAAQSTDRIRWSALVDAYYGWNANHPRTGANQLHLYDVNADTPSLSLARFSLIRDAQPLGFHVELGTGKAYTALHTGDPAPTALHHLPQAYLSFKPPQAKGLQLDFGKFYTTIGAEAFESQDNWNYSRSLLFSWAIPGYHFGLRASAPVNKHLTAGVQVVNGWNNFRDNNSGKSVGMMASVTAAKVTWTHNYLVGPEKPAAHSGRRHLYDTTVLFKPAERTNFYVNFDYGLDRKPGAGSARWVGVAGAARLALNRRFAVSPRVSWFNDADGFTTGTAQKLKEWTLTTEYRVRKEVLARLEYRRDWSNQPFFDRGFGSGVSRTQNTVLVALVATLQSRQ